MSVCVFPISRKPRFSEEYSDKIRNQIIPISSSFLPFKAKSFVLSVQEKPYRIHSFIHPPPSQLKQKKCQMIVLLCFGRVTKKSFHFLFLKIHGLNISHADESTSAPDNLQRPHHV